MRWLRMWGFGHRDLVHKIMQALRAFWIFWQSLPLFLRVALFCFLGLQALVLVPWVNAALRREGQPSLRPRCCHQDRAPGASTTENTGTDGGGEKVSVLFRLEKQNKKGLL